MGSWFDPWIKKGGVGRVMKSLDWYYFCEVKLSQWISIFHEIFSEFWLVDW